jgi:hypothetical protein
MKKPATFCDICSRAKQETNHWFIAVTDLAAKATGNTGIAFGTSDAEIDTRQLHLIEDICGQECLHKRLARWIEAQAANSAVTTNYHDLPPKDEVTP